jgi:hypothetical protein
MATSLPPVPFVPPIDFDPELYRSPTNGHEYK